jgi:hypothetical protein
VIFNNAMDLGMPKIIALLKMQWVYGYAYEHTNVTCKHCFRQCDEFAT